MTGSDLPGLPLDSDAVVADDRTAPRPPHLQWRFLGLVAVGGAIGTALREGLGLLAPPIDGVPYTTFGINVVGAAVLGLLLGMLARRGPDVGRRRALRLFAGTGVLGGFTTYSALATDTVTLLGANPAAGLAYSLGTVLLGAAASLAGIALAGALAGRQRSTDG